MTRLIALVVSLAVSSAGCASARAQGSRAGTQVSTSPADAAVIAAYVRQLPLGSRVRISLADGTIVRGTLMKADADPIVVQKRTRIPEPPLHIPINQLRTVEPEKNGGPGRAIAIGVAAGAGASLGVLLILAAIFSD